jgi:hypothetical protein
VSDVLGGANAMGSAPACSLGSTGTTGTSGTAEPRA